MTEIIAKKKGNNKMLPKHLMVDNIEINNIQSTAEKCDNFFVNISQKFTNQIPQGDLTFKLYLPKVNAMLNETVLHDFL